MIGCGDIAGGYDERHDSPDILSHAKAYREHPGFELVSCVEPDESRRREFQKIWNVQTAFADLDDLLTDTIDFDVASVCSPTPNHAEILQRLQNSAVKGVFCEKPVTDSLSLTKKCIDLYEKSSIVLAVNYLRRWDKTLEDLKAEVDQGTWGALQNAVCHYGKGISHNGSHMIDLLQFLFGPLKPMSVLQSQPGYGTVDPTLDARLTTQTGAPVYLIGNNARLFDLFETSLTFEKGQIILEQGTSVVRMRPIEENPRFKGHQTLLGGTNQDGDLGQALYRAVDNFYRAITEGAPLASDGRSALEAQNVCEQLMTMALNT